jgi:hypothetical protein
METNLKKEPRFQKDLFGNEVPIENEKLRSRFIMPPFSILDTRQGNWLNRKRDRMELGIKSELGRGDNLLNYSETVKIHKKGMGRAFDQDLMKKEKGPNGLLYVSNSGRDPSYYKMKRETEAKLGHKISTAEFEKDYYVNNQLGSGISGCGTSVFDPVLCELMYRWFCPNYGQIIDPFSGGSVRGIIAHYLDYKYIGIDLSANQIEENKKQAIEILADKPHPKWITGNSQNIKELCKGVEGDMIFSCPPYFDLEVYSDDPSDLSNMNWDGFQKNYKEIINKSCQLLKEDRFACFVVSEIRDKGGFYRNLVGLTINSFLEAGLNFYNDMILINVAGSLPIRLGRQFGGFRKVGRTHQNILVFFKGNPKNIPLYFEEMGKENEENKEIFNEEKIEMENMEELSRQFEEKVGTNKNQETLI